MKDVASTSQEAAYREGQSTYALLFVFISASHSSKQALEFDEFSAVQDH
jgi:hypothetical protein